MADTTRTTTTADTSRGDHDSNPDPITGSPGSHPVGTGIGSASGAATGAAIGALGGPLGMAIGAIAGGVTGGLIGHEVGETVDPTIEDEYWRENHRNQDYAQGDDYETYKDQYAYGYHAAGYHDEPFEEKEPHLREHYEQHMRQVGEGRDGMEYDKARGAIRNAYERVRENRRAGTTTA